MPFLNALFLNDSRATSEVIKNNPFLYSFYYAVTTGILEEAGILIAFKKILVNHDEKSTALMYAIGHAGLDVLLITGMRLIVYINCASTINALGIEGFKEKFEGSKTINVEEVIKVLEDMSVSSVLYIAFQRILYFAMHIFLTFTVFYSVKRECIAYFWIAVVLRGLCTVPGSVEEKLTDVGTGINVLLVVITTVLVAAAGYVAVRLYRNYDSEKLLLPSNLFRKRMDPSI